jgi:hypothetical protein
MNQWQTMVAVSRHLALAAALAVAAACSSEGANQTTSAPECAAKLKWSGGDDESPFMNPGMDCVGCHKAKGEGPLFQVAGTVFGVQADPDLCQGKSGIQVEVVDKLGTAVTLTTNEAGNFYLDDHGGPQLTLPLQVRVRAGGKEKAMMSPVTNGSCNACHTASGKNGAPGRIFLQ